jgi:hypothetical protein
MRQPLSIFAARSFWVFVLSVAVQFVPALDAGDVDPLAGHLSDVVSALLGAWALFFERRNPQRALKVLGPVW